MDLEQAVQTFITESRELLAEMEDALLGVADGTDAQDAINAIFRAAHTIKGSAGLFGIQYIVDFTHVVESVLDRVRDGEVKLDDALVAVLLGCHDTMGRLVSVAQAKEDGPDAELAQEVAELELRLTAYLGAPLAAAMAVPLDATPAGSASAAGGHWHLSLRFHEGVLRNGMDPLSFLRYLGRLGTVTGVVCDTARLPALAAMDASACYVGLEVGLQSTADQATIAGTFEFVQDDCDIHILPPGSGVAQWVALVTTLGDPAQLAIERLVACGSLDDKGARAVMAALDPAADVDGDLDVSVALAASAELAGPSGADAEGGAAALATPASGAARVAKEKPAESRSVRVDAAKLDYLINLVGELITASAGASLAAARAGAAELLTCNAQVASLVEAVRDSTLQLRMVKIGATFNRFRRVVHDVSRQLGKRIDLDVRGEDTELDKTVVERIGDPLTHLVRNAMDHGIEPAEARLAAGKPAHGTITLDARHDSGHIVITVSDDGRGLERERILAKARERGIVDGDRVMSDSEVYKLIFEPGFSTAAAVTDLSGRGVGMDVVKRNIEALRGSVDVESRAGHGTTVVIRLPLTLAIIDGFQVSVGRARLVLPLDMVDECIAYQAEDESDTRHYTELRGQVLPFIRLRDLFELPGRPEGRENIVVVRHGAQRIGLVVDTLLGETQAVIKPLSKVFAGLRGVSGTSILGSGDVALILDVPALMAEAVRTHGDLSRVEALA